MKDRQLTPHFRASEFRCRCRRPDCDAVPMDAELLAKAEALRVLWGLPLIVTSGQRCIYWNAAVGGAPASQHPKGKAVDFLVRDLAEAERLAAAAAQVGFGGIGIARTFVHVDVGPPGRRWRY